MFPSFHVSIVPQFHRSIGFTYGYERSATSFHVSPRWGLGIGVDVSTLKGVKCE